MVEGLLAEEVGGSTARTYTYAWSQFRKYCEEVKREALPAEVDMVVTYMAMVSEKGSVASAQTASSSIAHFHKKKFPGSLSPEGESAPDGHQEETWEASGQEGASHGGGGESSL